MGHTSWYHAAILIPLRARGAAMKHLEIVERVRPIVEEAGHLALKLREEGLKIIDKPDGTPVTNADEAVSEFLTHELLAAYPNTRVISEEHADLSGTNHPLTWAIDPIDGTKKYCAGKSVWCVMIALFDTQPIASIIYFPEGPVWYYAERGKGAYMEDSHGVHKLKVSEPTNPPRFVHAPHFEYPVGELGTYGFMKWTRKLVWHKIDAYLYSDIGYWDLIPPMLIATEAGGVVVDLHGKPVQLVNPNAVQHGCILGQPKAVELALAAIRKH